MPAENPDNQRERERPINDAVMEQHDPDAEPAETQRLRRTLQQYLAAQSTADRTPVPNDIEKSTVTIDPALGYVPYLRHLLTEVQDIDEWFPDSIEEQRNENLLLGNVSVEVQRNLKVLAQELDSATDRTSSVYKQLRAHYIQQSQALTELVSSIGPVENVELRDGAMGAEQIRRTMKYMTTEEAIDWTQRMMAEIDSNNWQSSGLRKTYGQVTNSTKQTLTKKLVEERKAVVNNPKMEAVHAQHCLEVAKLFSDRSTPIDNGLTDTDFAIQMAREAMQFDSLALRYAENSLRQQNQVKLHVDGLWPRVKSGLEQMIPQAMADPQVQTTVAIIESHPNTISGLALKYTVFRQVETLVRGGTQPDFQGELNSLLAQPLERAITEFDLFLGKVTGGLLTPGPVRKHEPPNLEQLQRAIGGPSLTPPQLEAWKLLSDIEGYDYNLGDKHWQAIEMGAKIAAMIAAGIAIGVATSGLGVIGAALAGGASMTAAGALIEQRGVDNIGEGIDVYGKEFAINATTYGASRYLSAGRTIIQGVGSGTVRNGDDVIRIIKMVEQAGGMKTLNQIDDATAIGTRLCGATAEASADTVVGASLDTICSGGTFVDNLKSNAMFFGLGYAEFAGPSLRGLRQLSDEDLHGVAQSVNHAELGKMKAREILADTTFTPAHLLETADLTPILAVINPAHTADLQDAYSTLNGAKSDLSTTLEKVKRHSFVDDVGSEQSGRVTRNQLSAEDNLMKDRVLLLDETREGRSRRLEAAEYLAGKPLTPEQKVAILAAHDVPMSNGEGYTIPELRLKMQILSRGGFSTEQTDRLLRMGVCGLLPKWLAEAKAAEALQQVVPKRHTNIKAPPPPSTQPQVQRLPPPAPEMGKAPRPPPEVSKEVLETSAPPKVADKQFDTRLAYAAHLANEGSLLETNGNLSSLVDQIIQTADVRLHSNVTDEQSGRYIGYCTYGNRAAQTAPAADLSQLSRWNPQPKRGPLNDLLQNPAQSKTHRYGESVRLGEPATDGKRDLVYMFTSPDYTDQPGGQGRPNALLGVGIRLDGSQAKQLFEFLKTNPSAVRSFFIAASGNVDRADYIWSKRLPPYENVQARSLIFAEERAPKDSLPPLELTYLQKKQGTWTEENLPSAAAGMEKEAVNQAHRLRHQQLNPPKPPSRDPAQERKSLRQWLFGE